MPFTLCLVSVADVVQAQVRKEGNAEIVQQAPDDDIPIDILIDTSDDNDIDIPISPPNQSVRDIPTNRINIPPALPNIDDLDSPGIRAYGSLILTNRSITSGDYHESLKLILEAINICQDIKDMTCLGRSYNIAAQLYRTLGKYNEAIDFYQKSLAIFEQKRINDCYNEKITCWQNTTEQVDALIGIGGIYTYSLRNPTKGVDFFQRSLQLSVQEKNEFAESQSLASLAGLYTNLGQYKKANNLHLDSLKVLRQMQTRCRCNYQYMINQESIIFSGLGNASFYLGEYEKAIGYYWQSLELAKKVGNRASVRISFDSLAGTFKNLNYPELAIIFYKQSINITESIRKNIQGLDQDFQKSYLATVEDSYRKLAELLLKQDRILEAQQVLDLLKVEEMSEYLKNVRGNDQTAKGTEYRPPEQNFIALALELDELQKRKLANNITPSEQERLNQLVQSEREQNKQFTAFLNSPAVKSLVEQLRRTEDQQNIDTQNLRSLRADILAQHPNAVILYPLILEDRLELILITAKTAPLRRTINIRRENLNQKINDFLIGLRDPKSTAQVKNHAQQLHTWLIKPFESELAQLTIDTIIYAPDGQLRYIPLSALYDGKQWLVEKYRVNNITAASLTKFNKPAIAKPKIFAGAFGNVNKQGFSGLPATLLEVKKIADRFPNTTTFIETAFTKTITEDSSNSYTVLHLATHGQLSNGRPEDSFILFGDGTKATIADINGWALTNVDLVVLSACQSGLGSKLGTGVEILGLGYQMQRAGARVAIASLWKVDDAGTQALMDAFYGELQKGDVPIAEALRRAQIAMIKSDKKGTDGNDRAGVRVVGTVPNSSTLSHPYYWSAFFAIGNGL
ncbi:CHAT domain-containing protein [Pseudanabaena sp. UWO310]|uniref:CHAT domain-containing protein n=1 Tax=Pseudanabaena sp. UWO310 TaxID=2480795 RepID=UPI001681014D|nr:CHAT domain-containing protein [Pseudanabaena sp. UWO310]